MKKTLRLTEKDLTKLIKRIVKEEDDFETPNIDHLHSFGSETEQKLKSILNQLKPIRLDFLSLYQEAVDIIVELDENSDEDYYHELEGIIETSAHYYSEIQEFFDTINFKTPPRKKAIFGLHKSQSK